MDEEDGDGEGWGLGLGLESVGWVGLAGGGEGEWEREGVLELIFEVLLAGAVPAYWFFPNARRCC